MIYQSAKEARRNNLKAQKQYEEELRQDELKFYRDLALKNMSKQKINVMFTSFHVNKVKGSQRPGTPWTVHVDPPQLQPQEPPPYRPRSEPNYDYFKPYQSYQDSTNQPSPYLPPPPPPVQILKRPPLTNTQRGNEIPNQPVVAPKAPPSPSVKPRSFAPANVNTPKSNPVEMPVIYGGFMWGGLCEGNYMKGMMTMTTRGWRQRD